MVTLSGVAARIKDGITRNEIAEHARLQVGPFPPETCAVFATTELLYLP